MVYAKYTNKSIMYPGESKRRRGGIIIKSIKKFMILIHHMIILKVAGLIYNIIKDKQQIKTLLPHNHIRAIYDNSYIRNEFTIPCAATKSKPTSQQIIEISTEPKQLINIH